jgi:predicted ATPase
VESYSFDEVQVLPQARKVLVRGKPVALTPRAYDLLLALIERRDHVVSKDELFDAVWPGMTVEENNIHVHVSALRKALGPAFLATLPGRGFRFAATVIEEPAVPGDAQSPRPHTNLPTVPDALVGREAELEALAERLGASRLVTVAGPGGAGKSRVAIAVARVCANRFRDGVWWVDLASREPGDAVGPAIAETVDIPFAGDEPAAGPETTLQFREALLVLDGCERVVAQAAAVADRILATAGRVTILATSQEPLRLPGERVFALQPLAVPPAGTPAAAARDFPALQLLARRVHSLDPTFRLGDADVACAVELCRRIDGMPLAIEMAAARVAAVGLRAAYANLGERLDLLRNPDHAAPPRQRALRAALDWSHSLLTPREQGALQRLSTFAGSFRLEPARDVIAAGGMDEWEALDTLAALCDKSLVRVEEGPTRRYRLPETTRLYAREALAKSGEGEAAIALHRAAVLDLALAAEREFRTLDRTGWQARYVPECEDFRAACERARDAADAEAAACLRSILGHLDAGCDTLSAAN